MKSTQDPLNEDGRYFNGDWHEDLTQCSHGDTGNYSNKRDGQFIAALWNAYRSGQLITLADHERPLYERIKEMNPHQIRKPPEERTIEEQLQIAQDFIASIGRGPSLGETTMGWMDNKIMEAKYWPNVPLPSDTRLLVSRAKDLVHAHHHGNGAEGWYEVVKGVDDALKPFEP